VQSTYKRLQNKNLEYREKAAYFEGEIEYNIKFFRLSVSKAELELTKIVAKLRKRLIKDKESL